MLAGNDLDVMVRAADPDRWLSSRLVGDASTRADLIALHAFEAELRAIPTRVSQPLLAEMRYAWWREQMAGVFAGRPRKGHPVLEALTRAVGRGELDRRPFEALIEAHIARVHGEPHDLEALFVGPMRAGARLLAGPEHEAAVTDAGRMWGLAQTGRVEEARALRREANRALRTLPAAGFPAAAHVALIGVERDAAKRLRLLWAALRGRV